jgi:hypothetical protein
MNRFKPLKEKKLIEQLEMCKQNNNDGDNLKSVYLIVKEIDYLIKLVSKTIRK